MPRLLTDAALTGSKFEIPLGMPTVFDPSFKGVGQKPGLDIWRVEKLKVIKKANTDGCYEGQLYEGDTYIVLQTKVTSLHDMNIECMHNPHQVCHSCHYPSVR